VQGFDKGLRMGVSYSSCLSVFSGILYVGTNGGEAIVRRTCECDQINRLGWLIDSHFTGVADGDFEEGGSLLGHV